MKNSFESVVEGTGAVVSAPVLSLIFAMSKCLRIALLKGVFQIIAVECNAGHVLPFDC